MSQIIARDRMRRLPHVAEILNSGVIVVVILLSRERIAFLPRPGVAHVHGQPAPSALPPVTTPRVVETLSQRKADVRQVAATPTPVVGLSSGHLWERRDCSQ